MDSTSTEVGRVLNRHRRIPAFGALTAILVLALAPLAGCRRAAPPPGSRPAAHGATLASRPGADERAEGRLEMVRTMTARYDDPAVADERVLAAMRAVPRHRFVPEGERDSAYDDSPLPIGCGQTISQPYIVGLMSQLLETKAGDRVLEVGTGSGYQAAVLAEMGRRVYTIEIFEELGTSAADRLKALGYDSVQVKVGDGYFGWKEEAPFDAIIVTCAATHVPPALIEQLKPGGRMAIPVGQAFGTQDLLVLTKDAGGRIRSRSLLPVRFVPLRGGHEGRGQ